jgi:RimJ/RimL family protein N-acetyltransferase
MIGNRLLQGDSIYLDALDRSDIPLLAAWWRSIELSQYLAQEALFPKNEEDETEWYESARKDPNVFVFAIRRQDDDTLVGTATLFNINWRIKKCLFGIALGDPTVWGKGLGTDATRVIIRYAFHELNLNSVRLYVYEFNERALKAYEKAGFKTEGIQRQSVYREGRYFDETVMSILRSEWKE